MGKVENYGFSLVKEDVVDEINSKARIYTHNESGARLLFLLNDDDNKVFSCSFKTPPEDDTGVAHIMEHSVLCGSRKYPVKEPFVELMKGSLNTFLNAMTYPDKTMYPVASRNLADFQNLVDVYMDAVFFPELAKEAFEQEGWHYEVEEQGLTYKGVVFNEMKGVFSSPESYLDMAVNRALYDESSYKYESGGYPPAIPQLTYEAYKKFHNEKYHPANSWIVLYGDLDENYWLDYLNEEYLSQFSAPKFNLPEIITQPSKAEPKDIACTYPSSDNEEGDRSLITLSFIIGSPIDYELNFAMGVLDTILIGSSGAPLKKALVESQLGRDTLDYGYSNESLQTSWSVGLRDTSPDKKEAFLKVIFETLEKLHSEGIPEKMVAAAMNTCEFQLREANFGSYPKGLIYAMHVMASWLYDGDPLEGLRYERLLDSLKEKIAKGGYFENLIKKVFLDNKNYVVATCNPDPDMGQALEKSESKELSEVHKSLSEKEIEELKKENQILIQRQATPDSPEALATIPRVSVKDLADKVERIPTEEFEKGGVKYLYHDLPSQKICYLHLNFDCSAVGFENFKWLSLYNTLLTKCGTKDISYDEFSQDIAIQTGGLNSTLNIYSSYIESGNSGCSLSLQGKAMVDKCNEFCELIEKVLFEVDFKDLDRVKNIIDASISRLTNTLQNNGDRVARNTLSSSLSKTGLLSNSIHNAEYLAFLKSVRTLLDKDSEDFLNKMNFIKERVQNKANLIINIAGDREVYDVFESSLIAMTDKLPEGSSSEMFDFELAAKENLGLSAPGSVQYVAKGINFRDLGYKNDGVFDLLNQLLSTGYLWEKVRVQGGAYGCYLSFDKISGALVVVSYRDPNLKDTVKVFDSIAEYLENLDISDSEFEKLLIGTIGRLDMPMTTSQKSKLALNRYLAGVDYKVLDERRKELLNATVEDLKKYAVYFRKLAQEGTLCVHGNANILETNKDLFDRIVSVCE